MKKVFKQSLICILSVMITITMFPAYAFAEAETDITENAEVIEAEIPETAEPEEELPDTSVVIEAELPEEVYSEEEPLDNDELFAEYAESILYGESEAPLLRARKAVPEGLNGLIYSKLKEEIALVADGTNSSTAFEVTLADLGLEGRTWTASELGVEAIVVNNAISQDAMNALKDALGINLNTIISSLLADCPYELYWYDKTVGVRMSGPGIGASYNGSEYVMKLNSGYTFSLAVAEGYSAGEYQVDTTKVDRVHHAVDTALAIVNNAASENDYNKLYSYKDAICSRVTYNHDAANDDTTPYGDPWQLISVFDDDAATNVVCEGYSKAFQYLCDKTAFDGDINCVSVSGHMDGGTGAGAHMWNIVTMENGLNYLVDVTNCDEGSIGAPDQLFLAGFDSGSKDTGYTFNANGSGIGYTYNEDTLNLYSSELEIADSDYTYHEWGDWIEVTPATCTEGGLEKRTCSLCGEEQTRGTEALGHDYVEDADSAVASTCIEEGREADQICSRCGDTIHGEIIPSLGHELTKVDAKEATKTEEGNIEYWICETCGNYFADSEGLTEISAESVVVPMIPSGILASGPCGDNATFVLHAEGDFIVSGTGKISDFTLFDGYRNSIKNIVLEEGIQEIASYAFKNCTNLESITIPQSLTVIEMDVFEGCTNLKRVDISDISKYASIGNWGYLSSPTCYSADLFLNGELITDLVIPADVKYVDSYAFYGCDCIISAVISDGVSSLGNNIFNYCTNLKSIVIPDTVISAGYEPFWGCDNLTEIYVVKDSFAHTWLEQNGFSDKIRFVVKEDEHYYIEEIINNPDCGNPGTKKLTCVICGDEKTAEIPATGNHIWDEGVIVTDPTCVDYGEKLFTCTVCGGKMTDTIPPTGIHNWTDGEIVKEPTCEVPGEMSIVCSICGTIEYKEIDPTGAHVLFHMDQKDPTSIEDGNIDCWCCEQCGRYFSDSEGKNELDADSIIIPRYGPEFRWSLNDGVLTLSGVGEMNNYDYYELPPWYSNKDEILEINIIEGLTSIGSFAFKDLTNVTKITIPDGVKRIEEYAFSGCSGITEIIVPDSLYYIGECAFVDCSSLTRIPFHSSVTHIGRGVFGGCTSLKIITIPDTVGYIETESESEWNKFTAIYVVKGSAADKYLSDNPNLKKLLEYVTPMKGHYCYDVCTSKATVSANGKADHICSACGEKVSTSDIYKPATFTLSATSYTYSGGAKKPSVTIKDSKGKTIESSNYTVTYSNNVKIGTATAKVTFKGDYYTGTKSLDFKIRGNLANTATKVTVSKVADKTYTGKVIEPTLNVKAIGTAGTVVTLKSGTDYTLSYSANKNVGKATITITGKGNYTGTKKVTFKINPKGTSLKTLTATSKGFKATWTKQATKMSTSYITGYQIQYSTSSTFASGNTTVTATKYSTVSKTISKLKAKKKYYVRIRTYKTVSGVKYYSPWSASKYVTTKA